MLRICLGGLAAGRDVFDLARDLASLHPKNNTFPGEVLLELAADALEEAEATRDDPVAYETSGSGTCPSASSEASTITGQATTR